MQNLEYTDGKRRFIGDLAGEDGGAERRPGIVVFPEAFGLGDHAKKRAQRLAKLCAGCATAYELLFSCIVRSSQSLTT
jgi:dienelactone hydrolase